MIYIALFIIYLIYNLVKIYNLWCDFETKFANQIKEDDEEMIKNSPTFIGSWNSRIRNKEMLNNVHQV